MSFSLCLPAWSIGEDCYKEIYHFARTYGTKAAVIGGHTALSKAYDKIADALKGTDLELTDPIWFGGQASYENAEMLKAMPEVKDADMIFAVGGGRAMDCCKVVADHLEKPLLTFPTLGSNCASATEIAIMYHPDGKFRNYYYPKRCPNHTFLNSAIVADSPAEMLWAGIGDSIAKEYESELAARGDALTHVPTMGTTIAKACTAPLMNYGPKAMELIKKKQAGEALDECVLAIVITAGLVSNMTISTDNAESYYYNASAAHCFYNASTVIPACGEGHLHGEIVSFGIQVLLALDHQYDRLKEFQAFCRSLGLPTTMKDIDLTPEDLPAIADKAADGSIVEWGKWPYDVTKQGFIDAILEASKYGEEFK